MSAKYRADVDGLRALAVVPVVLYHAHTPGFGGGFVGVDVFFVISGFLITQLISAEMDARTFSIANFYERRIRRIFPALFTVVALSALLAWYVMSPADFDRFGKSVAGTALFLSNVSFWHMTDYFGAPTAEMPLLHTWSLAVEEQYYLVFPLLMYALTRWMRRQRTLVIALLCVASFIGSAFGVFHSPAGTFYLAPTRAWELGLGALLALGAVPTNLSPKARNLTATLGVALIVIATLFYTEAIPFPGLAALPPSLGAALVILAGINGLAPTSRLLATAPFVGIGKISYSFYLWHFPLLAFGAYLSIDPLSPLQLAGLVIASAVLACLSYQFIEQPARHRSGPAGQRRVLIIGAVVTVLFWSVGFTIDKAKGFPSRMSAEKLAILAGSDDHNRDRTRCFVNAQNHRRAEGHCAFYGEDSKARFVLWGDSHAEAMRPAFRELAQRFKVSGTFMGDSGCPPVLGVDRTNKPGCAASAEAVLDWIIANPSVGTVVLAGRWGWWAHGTGFKHEQLEPTGLKLTGPNAPSLSTPQALERGLERTVARLQGAGREVWIVGPTPEVGFDVPMSRYRHALGIDPDVSIDPLRTEYMAREHEVFRIFETVRKQAPKVRFVWPHEVLCDQRICRTEADGKALYYDDDHISGYGAHVIAPVFVPLFDSIEAEVLQAAPASQEPSAVPSAPAAPAGSG